MRWRPMVGGGHLQFGREFPDATADTNADETTGCGYTHAHDILIVRSRFFFNANRANSSFRNTACTVFYLLFSSLTTPDAPTRGVRQNRRPRTRRAHLRPGCSSRKCNFKGVVNRIRGAGRDMIFSPQPAAVTTSNGCVWRMVSISRFLRFDVYIITYTTWVSTSKPTACGA